MRITYRLEGDRELVMYLGKVADNIKPYALKGLNEAGEHLEREVKAKFGKYHSSWPKLKRASVIAKYKRRGLGGAAKGKGAASYSVGGDDPLVLFGKLRDSIEKDLKAGQLEVEIFSDNVYAAVHEYGYAPKGVPARSYMRTTLSEEADEVVKIVDKNIGRAL